MDQIPLAVSSLDYQCQVLAQSHLHQSTQSADGIRSSGKHTNTDGSESVSELARLTVTRNEFTIVSYLVSIQSFPCNCRPIRKDRPRNSTSHCNCESFSARKTHREREREERTIRLLPSSILEHEPDETVPLVLRQTVDFIKNFGRISPHPLVDRTVAVGSTLGLNEPGIFRRAALVSLIKQIQQKYNEGELNVIVRTIRAALPAVPRSTRRVRTVRRRSSGCLRPKNIPTRFIRTVDDLPSLP